MNTMKYLVGSKSGKMNGRMYDPVVSRFISPDPFIQSPYQSESFNRYSYCMNNPMRFTDPSGYLATGQEAGLAERMLSNAIKGINEHLHRELMEWFRQLDSFSNHGGGYVSPNANRVIYSSDGKPILSGVVGEIGEGLFKSYTDISGIGVEFNQRTGEIMLNTTHVYSVGGWVKLGDKYWKLNTTVCENVTRSLADVLGYVNNNGSGGVYDNADYFLENTSTLRDGATFANGLLDFGTDSRIPDANSKYQPAGFNPAAEAKVAKGMKIANGVLGVTGKALGVLSAAEHGNEAYKAFESGDTWQGIGYSALTALDFGLMFVKTTNPFVLAGVITYSILDMSVF